MAAPTYSMKLPFYVIILTASFTLSAADLIKGDSDNETQSFIHPIKACCIGAASRFYIGASEPESKEFAIAGMIRESDKFFPLTPEKVNVNEKEEQQNPLYNSSINLMTMLCETDSSGLVETKVDRIAATLSTSAHSLYLIDSSTDPKKIRVLSNDNIMDATGTQQTSNIISLSVNNDKVIFAAVNDHNEQLFGKGNSGIAIIGRQITQEKQQDDTTIAVPHLVQVDAEPTQTPEQVTRAAKLNNETPCFKIGSDTKVEILNNDVSMFWSTGLPAFYAGFSLKAQSQQEYAGARAVVVGYVILNKIIYKKIAPDNAFDKKNNIVGGLGSNVTISIHQVLALSTTTMLNYLVVLGGNTSIGNTRRTVYALPVVSNKTNLWTHGVLAKKDSVPTNFYKESNQLEARGFIVPAENPGDLYSADDVAVQVGHGSLKEGDITHVFAYHDAVYAIVTHPDEGYKGGIFHSQAIFDELGRIKEWTSWKRVGGNFYDQIHYAHIDTQTGIMTMMCSTSNGAINTVKRTHWASGDKQGLASLVTWLNQKFSTEISGIAGLNEFTCSTPGLNQINLLVATGNNRVALAQLATCENCPLGGTDIARNPIDCFDGSINQKLSEDSNAILITGGALTNCGTISSSAITATGNSGYLFVGGSKGLAVLLNDKGYSWDSCIGLANNLVGLEPNSAFKQIGSYKFIRSLFCDHEHALLYIICDERIDRINIATSNFLTGDISVQTIAQRNIAPFGRYETFFDGVFSKNNAIIGTSSGLYRISSDHDVRNATLSSADLWNKIPLAEGLSSVKYIQFITATNRPQDYTQSKGGNIYVLDVNNSKHRSMIHRFTVKLNSAGEITINPLPDHFIYDHPSYYAEFDGYRDWFNNDGMLFFHARKRNNPDEPMFALLSPYTCCGIQFAGNINSTVPVDLNQASIIRPLVRLHSSGAWLLAKDDKLVVHE